jgi:formate dehydrogenase maturation protein FdhE
MAMIIMWLRRFLPIRCPVCGAKKGEPGWVLMPEDKRDPSARFVRCHVCKGT